MTYPKLSDPDVRRRARASPRSSASVLAFWKADDTFRASIENREGAPEWVFYDGPPFANGLPHYGHLLTGYAKDVFPRFQTMRGKQVDRVFGWDTHGLPAELEAMKQLGITEKDEIERMGVATFNAKARESVLEYTREWQDYVTRQARWVDFERGYKTLDTDYMESVLWAFKTLYDKGLAYEGYRVLPYCWRDETPLSSHELRMDDDVYKMRQDPSVTVTFPLVGVKAEALGLTARARARLDDDPVDAADEPRPRGRPRRPIRRRARRPARRRRRAPRPDGSGTWAARARRGESHRYLLAEDLLPNYAKDLGYESAADAAARRRARPSSAPSWPACTTTACSTTTPTPRPGARRTRGRSSSTTTSRPATAPASCTRHPRTARTTSVSPRPPASPRSSASTTAGASFPQ